MNPLQVGRVAFLFAALLSLSSCGVTDKTLGRESSLCSSVRNQAVSIVRDMLERGENPNGYCTYEYGGNYYIARTKISRPLLTTAINGKNAEIVRLLIKAGANVNATLDLRDQTSMTPLSIAIEQGDLPTAKLLLERGANPDGNKSYIPLSIALGQKRLDLVNLLLQSGANPNIVIPIETTRVISF
jgi:ankyrin repeat protein